MTHPYAFVIYLVLGALTGAGLSVLNVLYAKDKDTPTEPPRHIPRLLLMLGYFAGVLLMAATAYRYDPSKISWHFWWSVSAFTSALLVYLGAKAIRNHHARKVLRRWRYGAAAAGLFVLLPLGTGCSSPTDIFTDLKDDHAAVSLTVVTPWGTQKISRVNPAANQSASITADGVMTITSK